MQLKVKLLSQTAKLPTRGTSGAAGLDLYADLGGEGNETAFSLIPTGIAIAIPPGYVGLIRDRSSLAKHGFFVVGGVIDSDFRGNIQVMLRCAGDWKISIEHGQRIAQLLIVPCPQLEVVEVTELDATERGAGGFGSTGR